MSSQPTFISRNVILNKAIFLFTQTSSDVSFNESPLVPHSSTIIPLASNSTPMSTPHDTPNHTTTLPSSTHSMMTRQEIKSLKPKLFPNHYVHNTTIESIDAEPTCYTHAIKHN
jgi:hypothetical protein